MSFQYERYVKKAKKEHRCEWCSAHIKVGDGYYASSGHNGDFYAYALCERCHDVMGKFFYEIFGEYVVDDLGEFYESIIAGYGLSSCPVCGAEGEDTLSEDGLSMSVYCGKCGHRWAVDLSYESISAIIERETKEVKRLDETTSV
jgi:hypothetical protein